ncbi:lipoprotein [Dactylosporangium sucinum]|uniref:Lipoprotein n=2 Tax=Dactylosporangium sucinum TaxID=1424081 RepID=A0A917UFC4_9ACTN|nr:lipoprotein [Dactylosporangium sucinum]
MARFIRWYGANPLHLLALIAAFAVAGYAAVRLFAVQPVGVAVWLVGAAIAHDLILFPLYALADRSARSVLHRRAADLRTVRSINYLRVPTVLSGLLLLVWFPLIFRMVPGFEAATALSQDVYLGRWLAITAVLYGGAALAFALSVRRTRPADGESRV